MRVREPHTLNSTTDIIVSICWVPEFFFVALNLSQGSVFNTPRTGKTHLRVILLHLFSIGHHMVQSFD